MTEIYRLLEARHAKDCFVAECNTGSAWRGCRRMDAWVLRSTWSPVTTIGYEIKTDRHDFLRDDKWPEYLPYCHLFYFVCPPKLIDRAEVPEGCGLIYAGKRLYTRVKAPRRAPDAEKLRELMTYVLMSRISVKANMHQDDAGDASGYWRAWLERREQNDVLGRSVSREFHRRLRAAEDRAQDAERDLRSARNLVQALEDRGLQLADGRQTWSARHAVDRLLREEQGQRAISSLRSSHEALGRLIQSVEAVRDEAIGREPGKIVDA
jgi:hypothetical protein